MVYSFFHLFLIFFIYSVIGYIIEIVTIFLNFHKLNLHRGFLLGPYLPVFGIGGVLMNALLQKYLDDPFALFCMSMFICSTVEYFSSLLLEKIFKLRWWDYKDKKFNINGRICLENAFGFGIGGVLFLKFVNPTIIHFIDTLSEKTVIMIGCFIFVLFLGDILFTLNSLLKINIDFNYYLHKDATDEVKKQMKANLQKGLFGTVHIFKSFPKTSYKNNKSLKNYKEELFEVAGEKELLNEKNK